MVLYILYNRIILYNLIHIHVRIYSRLSVDALYTEGVVGGCASLPSLILLVC